MGVNTDNGCIQFRTLLSIAGLATEFARRPTTGETWETWGVPRNSTVESVRIQGYQDRTVLATMLLSHTIKMRVIGSDGLVVHSGSTNLVNDTLANTVHMSWDQSTEGIFLQLMQTDKTQQRMCVWN